MRLHIGDRSCSIDLLENVAPKSCAGLKEVLPLRTILGHAKFAGEEVIFMVPRLFERENIVNSVSPGDVGYYPDRQTICIFYGGIVPFAQVGLVGRVSDGLQVLRDIAPAIWAEPRFVDITYELKP
jgi:hypothetical protein